MNRWAERFKKKIIICLVRSLRLYLHPSPRDTFVHSLIEKTRNNEKNGRIIIDITCEEERTYLHLLQEISVSFSTVWQKILLPKLTHKSIRTINEGKNM